MAMHHICAPWDTAYSLIAQVVRLGYHLQRNKVHMVMKDMLIFASESLDLHIVGLFLLLFWHAPRGMRSTIHSLYRGRFWARLTASFNVRLWVLRSRWTVFINVMRGRSGGLLQFWGEGEPLGSSWHLPRHPCPYIVS